MSLWKSQLYSGGSGWPCGLRRGSAATRMLGLRVRIPLRTWMFVSCKCSALSGRGLCEELITHPEESYRLQYVVACDIETSRMRTSWPALDHSARKTNREEWVSNTGLAILRDFLWFFSISPVPLIKKMPLLSHRLLFIDHSSMEYLCSL